MFSRSVARVDGANQRYQGVQAPPPNATVAVLAHVHGARSAGHRDRGPARHPRDAARAKSAGQRLHVRTAYSAVPRDGFSVTEPVTSAARLRSTRWTQPHLMERAPNSALLAHNPKVVGSNPTPATIEPGQEPRFGGASLVLSSSTGSSTEWKSRCRGRVLLQATQLPCAAGMGQQRAARHRLSLFTSSGAICENSDAHGSHQQLQGVAGRRRRPGWGRALAFCTL